MHINHDALQTFVDNVFFNEVVGNGTLPNNDVPNNALMLSSTLCYEEIEDGTRNEANRESRVKNHPFSVVDLFEKKDIELNKENVNPMCVKEKPGFIVMISFIETSIAQH